MATTILKNETSNSDSNPSREVEREPVQIAKHVLESENLAISYYSNAEKLYREKGSSTRIETWESIYSNSRLATELDSNMAQSWYLRAVGLSHLNNENSTAKNQEILESLCHALDADIKYCEAALELNMKIFENLKKSIPDCDSIQELSFNDGENSEGNTSGIMSLSSQLSEINDLPQSSQEECKIKIRKEISAWKTLEKYQKVYAANISDEEKKFIMFMNMQLLNSLAYIYEQSYDYIDGISCHLLALHNAKMLNMENQYQSHFASNLAVSYLNSNRFNCAKRWIVYALELDGDSEEENHANHLNTLGLIDLCLADLSNALDVLEKSLNLAKTKNYLETETKVLINLAKVNMSLGLKDEAAKHLQNSLLISLGVKDFANAGIAQLNLAIVLYHCGKYSLAFKYLTGAEKMIQDSEDQFLIHLYRGIMLSRVCLESGFESQENSEENIKNAILNLERARALSIEMKNSKSQAISSCHLGNAFLVQGKFSESEKLYNEAISLSRKIQTAGAESGTERTLFQSLFNYGHLLLLQHRPSDALVSLLEAEKLMLSMLDNLKKIPVYDKYMTSWQDESTISECGRLIQLGYFMLNQKEAALEVAERSRARSFSFEMRKKTSNENENFATQDMLEVAIEMKSVLIYFSEISSALYFCWIIFPNPNLKMKFILFCRNTIHKDAGKFLQIKQEPDNE